jgi:nucleoside phosphorylase
VLSVAEVCGSVDFGILTVRADEYTAVLEHFLERETVRGRGYYEFSRVPIVGGRQVGVAVARCIDQGQGPAHDAARDLIDDLNPGWILLVGIAGGVPDDDYSLGDVLLASRIYDFSVSAEIQDEEAHKREWNVTGGPVHPQVAAILAAIPGWKKKFKGWNRQQAVGMKKPACAVPKDLRSDRYYGPQDFRTKVQSSLQRNFPANKRSRPPQYVVLPIGSGNVLVKDPSLIAEWRQSARSLGFVEMESGGVYRAARRHDREYPVLVVRGLSDIIGFKRGAAWTAYACRSAAAFAAAFIRSGVVAADHSARPKSSTKPPNEAPNPLHHLIDELGGFVGAAWRCHQARTMQEKEATLDAWRKLNDPFWKIHRIPKHATRALADPALAWCSKRGLAAADHIETVERAVDLLVGLAMIAAPCALPSVYANPAEAHEVWDRHGKLILASIESQDSLRRLTALAGDEWRGTYRLPWDEESPNPPAPIECTSDAPPPEPAASAVDTRPDAPEPPASLVEAAMTDLPQTIADMENTREYVTVQPQGSSFGAARP